VHQQAVAELSATVQADRGAAEPGSATLILGAPVTHVAVAVSTVEVQGEYAVARVLLYNEHGLPAYRQTRFYRRAPSGWGPTAPDPTLWGPERRLETPFFVYHFRQSDAQAVVAVAPQLDAMYTTIRRHLGLPLTLGAAKKLDIEVSVTQPPGQGLPWGSAAAGIVVPSPARYLAPVALSEADLLAQSIVLPLIEQVSAQAAKQDALVAAWQPLLSGLRLWQVWDLPLPLATWRADVVQWLYVDVPAGDRGQPFVLPDHYEALCTAHKLWLVNPSSLGIPLFCNERDRKDPHLIWRGGWPPLARLDQLVVSATQEWIRGPSLLDSEPGVPVALATLIEYAVATYGRDRLPMLVAGLGHYPSWETLIPAVYGVSSAQFEAGWQAYLATHYSVALDTFRK
jgi:hypothetical protein